MRLLTVLSAFAQLSSPPPYLRALDDFLTASYIFHMLSLQRPTPVRQAAPRLVFGFQFPGTEIARIHAGMGRGVMNGDCLTVQIESDRTEQLMVT